jgi:hypothetical protein
MIPDLDRMTAKSIKVLIFYTNMSTGNKNIIHKNIHAHGVKSRRKFANQSVCKFKEHEYSWELTYATPCHGLLETPHPTISHHAIRAEVGHTKKSRNIQIAPPEGIWEGGLAEGHPSPPLPRSWRLWHRSPSS